jgi:hypothetical protein
MKVNEIKLPKYDKNHNFCMCVKLLRDNLCEVEMFESNSLSSEKEIFYYDSVAEMSIGEAVNIVFQFAQSYPTENGNSFELAMCVLFTSLREGVENPSCVINSVEV